MRTTGVVTWFNDVRGFGFIAPDNKEPDCFVHFSGIRGGGRKTLPDGARVEFDVVVGEKGRRAENVVTLEESTYRRAS